MTLVEQTSRAPLASPSPPSRKPASLERTWNTLTAVALFAALPLLTEHLMPRLVQSHDYLNLDVGVAIAVAALSLNLLLGYTGQISLGHGGLLAAGAFASGIATSRWHAPMALGMLLAVLAAAALSFVVGLPALRLRGLYLAIVTVVFGLVMQYSVLRSTVFSGGSAGVALPRRLWGARVFTDNATYLVVCLLLLVAVWTVDVNVTRSRLGRAFRSIREDESVAAAAGIPVTHYKLLAFVVSGAMAGLAGAMYGHAIGFVNNEKPFDFNLSLMLVILVIVGGQGRRLPIIITALIFWIFPSFISGLHAWAYIIGAVGLMLTMALHPEGVADLLHPVRRPAPTAAGADADPDAERLPVLPQLPLPTALRVERAPAAVGPLLEVVDVSVSFGGLTAVDQVSLTVPAGRIVGLIGPNGAGKSTLFNAISGLVRVQSGVICFRGQQVQGLRCDQRARLGLARSFQHLGLAKDLSVRENFLLAQHQLAPYSALEALLMLPRALRYERELSERAELAIDALGFGHLTDTPVRHLSGGQQRIVEIACLLVTAPELVLLDEPSAGMAPAAAESLVSRLRELRDALGRTVLLIEHNVPLVLDACDEIYVLDAGRLIAHGAPEQIAANQQVVDAYFGREVLV